MRRKKLIIILSILILAGCANQDIKPDHSACSPHDLLTQATNSVYRVQTIMAFKTGENQKERGEVRTGNAFAVDSRRFLTAAHVVSIDEYLVHTPYGIMTIVISPEDKMKEEVWLLLGNSRILTKVIYKDLALDFAMLEVENEMPIPAYSLGNSDNFHILDHVFIISNVGRGMSVKSGHIMQLDYVEYEELNKVKKINEDMFGLCLAIKVGDSGSPVFLIRDGRIEVGGLVSLGDMQGTGYGIKINSIMDDFRAWQNERQW